MSAVAAERTRGTDVVCVCQEVRNDRRECYKSVRELSRFRWPGPHLAVLLHSGPLGRCDRHRGRADRLADSLALVEPAIITGSRQCFSILDSGSIGKRADSLRIGVPLEVAKVFGEEEELLRRANTPAP